MTIEIFAIGGYNEVGKNCTAVKIKDEAVILDLGLHLENYIKCTEEEEDIVSINVNKLMKAGAIPDISVIDEIKDKVKAIIPTHAHLDHVGAVPYIANVFNAPLICTPFTTAVVKSILKDEGIKIRNKIKTLSSNSHYKISENISIEFVHVTHSTPQTVIAALHTKHGIILYANDFKFDSFPVLGKKPNFKRLEEIGKSGVEALILDSTYAADARKTPSESVAKEMLKDVMLGTNSRNNIIIATTFASHIARLKSIVEFGKKLNRKIIFMGRSLAKYVKAAENIGIVDLSKDVEIIKYSKQIKKKLRKIEHEREKYLLVVTGHQGEHKSVLYKIAINEFKFKLYPEDHIIFSCKTIPTETNIKNRAELEELLHKQKVRIFKDIHQSGHAAKEDLRDLINLVKPKNIIPAHGSKEMKKALAELAVEMGYKLNENVFLLKDGQKLMI